MKKSTTGRKAPAKKRSPRVKKVDERIQVAVAIDVMTRGVAELYPVDPSAPGLVVAYLKKEAVHYASMVRYDQPNGMGKQVLASAKGKTLLEAIQKLLTNWKEGTRQARRMHSFNVIKTGLQFDQLGEHEE